MLLEYNKLKSEKYGWHFYFCDYACADMRLTLAPFGGGLAAIRGWGEEPLQVDVGGAAPRPVVILGAKDCVTFDSRTEELSLGFAVTPAGTGTRMPPGNRLDPPPSRLSLRTARNWTSSSFQQVEVVTAFRVCPSKVHYVI